MHTEFTLMLEAESLAMTEGRSSSMSTKQRSMVSKLGRTGWEIRKKEKDKVVMQKGDKEMFVYSSGETFVLSEGKEQNVTEMMETLLEGSEVLEEGIIQNLIGKFKSTKPKMKMYSNGRDGVIAIATANGTTSIYHTEKGEVVFENSVISQQALEDYIEKYEQKGYQKIRNKATLYRVLGLIAGAGAIGLGAGVMAAVGVRLVSSLMAMYEDTQNAQVAANSEQIEDAREEVMGKIDSSIQMSGDTLTVDTAPLESSIEATEGSSGILDFIMNTPGMVALGTITGVGGWFFGMIGRRAIDFHDW